MSMHLRTEQILPDQCQDASFASATRVLRKVTPAIYDNILPIHVNASF